MMILGSARASRTLSLAACVAATALSGCAPDGPTAAPVVTSGAVADVEASPQRLAVSLQQATVEPVARALALSLSDPAVRTAVRDAMRASLWTEHKLVLQEFALTAEGRSVIEAAAAASGLSLDSLQARIAKLPRLDFYVPRREHRRTWRGTPDVVIAVHVGEGPVVPAFTASGERLELDLNARDRGAILVLQSEEVKTLRLGAQVDRPGEVIQDAHDGEIGGRELIRLASGDSLAVDLADPDRLAKVRAFLTGAQPVHTYGTQSASGGIDFGAEGGVTPMIWPCEVDPSQHHCQIPEPPPPTDTTFLYRFATNQVCDNDNCGEGNEFEFKTNVYRQSDGSSIGYRSLMLTGWAATQDLILSNTTPLIFAEVHDSDDRVEIAVVEKDQTMFNPDDDWYRVAVVTQSANFRSYGDVPSTRFPMCNWKTGQPTSCLYRHDLGYYEQARASSTTARGNIRLWFAW